MLGFDIFVLVVVALIVLTIIAGVKTVPQGYTYTIERFGRYTRALSPGLGLIIPFIDRIGSKMNMMEQVLNVPSQEVITRDNAMVQVDGVTFFQILDAAQASLRGQQSRERHSQPDHDQYSYGHGLDGSGRTSFESVTRSTTSFWTWSTRQPRAWGVKVTRIEIKDINPPRDLVDAMARQMKAERDKRAEILIAEGERQSEILKAEGEKQAQILAAEGRREAAFRDAEAREREAEAEAKATEMVSTAIAAGNVQAINYFRRQQLCRGTEGSGQGAEPEGSDAAGRSLIGDRLHRRPGRNQPRGLQGRRRMERHPKHARFRAADIICEEGESYERTYPPFSGPLAPGTG